METLSLPAPNAMPYSAPARATKFDGRPNTIAKLAEVSPVQLAPYHATPVPSETPSGSSQVGPGDVGVALRRAPSSRGLLAVGSRVSARSPRRFVTLAGLFCLDLFRRWGGTFSDQLGYGHQECVDEIARSGRGKDRTLELSATARAPPRERTRGIARDIELTATR